MKILTWNVNSLKTLLQYHPWSSKSSWAEVMRELDADIVCLQETKVQREKLERDFAIVQGYDAYFSFSQVKKGYSGVVRAGAGWCLPSVASLTRCSPTHLLTYSPTHLTPLPISLLFPSPSSTHLTQVTYVRQSIGCLPIRASDRLLDESMYGEDMAAVDEVDEEEQRQHEDSVVFEETPELDLEGRTVVTDHRAFVLFNMWVVCVWVLRCHQVL